MPNYAALPSEAGNELPINQPPRDPPAVCTPPEPQASRPVNPRTIFTLIMVLIVVAFFGCLYLWYTKCGPGKKSGGEAPATPAAMGGGGGGGGAHAARHGTVGLLPGWTACVDEGSGQTYYYHAATGETTWQPPVAKDTGPIPPPPAVGGPPAPPALPAGWSTAVDPNSGQTYYMNAATGATSWTPP